MKTNNPESNSQMEDVVKLVNLEEETILVAKCSQQLPEGTKIKEIKVVLDPPLPGGGGNCGWNWSS